MWGRERVASLLHRLQQYMWGREHEWDGELVGVVVAVRSLVCAVGWFGLLAALLVGSGCGCLRLVAALGGCCLVVGRVVVWTQGCS